MQSSRTTHWSILTLRTVLAVALVASLLPAAPARGNDLIPDWWSVVDLNKFEQNIRQRFETSRTTGYAYAIYWNASLMKSGGGGEAVWSSTPMTADTRGDLFSMTKTITATATMRALEIMQARGESVTVFSPIAPYLPLYWRRGPDVEDVRFYHLLQHTSGLRPGSGGQDRYLDVEQSIDNGVDTTIFGTVSYCGCNYALLRVLLARMLHGPYFNPVPWGDEDATASEFVSFVRQHVVGPAGIDHFEEFSGPTPYTRYYQWTLFLDPNQYSTYAQYSPRRYWVGPGFAYMSVKEFGAFLSRLRRGEIVSAGTWGLMQLMSLGVWPIRDAVTAAHGGDYFNHDGGPGDNRGGSGWVMFPYGITAVAFHNSSAPAGHIPTLLRQSFEAANPLTSSPKISFP